MKTKKKLKWIKTFEYYMNIHTPEYFLYYSTDYNLNAGQIIELILSVEGVKSATIEEHKFNKNKPVIVFSIDPTANEGLVFSKVFKLLEATLVGDNVVVKEKMW